MSSEWQLTESSAGTISLLLAPDPAQCGPHHNCIQHSPRTYSCNDNSRGQYMVSKNLQAIEALEICWSTDEAILSLRKLCKGCHKASGVTELITEGLRLEETLASCIVQYLCSCRALLYKQVAQEHVQKSFEYFQVWRLCHLPGQLVHQVIK